MPGGRMLAQQTRSVDVPQVFVQFFRFRCGNGICSVEICAENRLTLIGACGYLSRVYLIACFIAYL